MHTPRQNTLMLLWIAAATLCCSDRQAGGSEQTASTVEPLRTVDQSYRPAIDTPEYEEGLGPVVCIDETHNNFHTADGTYLPFAALLRRDGYVVERAHEPLTLERLSRCDVLVIADAQPPANSNDPPTFSDEEIARLYEWVIGGGSLFVITDHMPDPGALVDLALTFGIEVNNGYVLNGGATGTERPIVFDRINGTIMDDPITNGRGPSERVEAVATFTGAAFRGQEPLRPLLVFDSSRRSWMPEEYWEFERNTPVIPVGGWFQGAVGEYGEGRLAFFGEAAMFTAQVFNNGNVKAGMNSPVAQDNAQLLLNVMHWLTRVL